MRTMSSDLSEMPDVPTGWRPTRSEPVPVVRCTAIKKDGERCRRYSLRGATVCIKHGAQLPNVQEHAKAVVEAARLRIIGLSDEAIDVIYDLLTTSPSDKIRLDAAKDLLDRANIKGAQEIDIKVTQSESPAEKIRRRLQETQARLQSATEEVVVDAEVVEPEPPEQTQGEEA